VAGGQQLLVAASLAWQALQLAAAAPAPAPPQQQQQLIQARLQGCWLAEAYRCLQWQLQLLVLWVPALLVAVLPLLVLGAGQAAQQRSSPSKSPSQTGLTPCRRRTNMKNTTSSSNSRTSSKGSSWRTCRSHSMTPGVMASLLLLISRMSPLLKQRGARLAGRQQQQQQRTLGKVRIGCL
jgi:hypothetical protein